MLSTALAVMYGTVHVLYPPPPFLTRSLSPVNMQLSWGRADGWAQLATCRRSQTLRASLSGVGGGAGGGVVSRKHSAANWPPSKKIKNKKFKKTLTPGHPDQCNKQRKECAISSTDTDTLRVSRMCQNRLTRTRFNTRRTGLSFHFFLIE